jgi:catechol 2,3-dioxygenase-like lactoylglutathione lyase family enzyme
MTKNKLLRMDNVGIVVESLDEAISFFTELGLKLEGRAMIEGEWAGRVMFTVDPRDFSSGWQKNSENFDVILMNIG